MSIIQHIKLVSPQPEEVRAFLVDVAELPDGWAFEYQNEAADDVSEGMLSWERVMQRRGASGPKGYIVGDTKSRQLQILGGATGAIWSVAIATQELERVHERCRERRLDVTEIRSTPFAGNTVEAFFVEVGGVLFEFLRISPARA